MSIFQSLVNSAVLRKVGDFNLRLDESFFAAKDTLRRYRDPDIKGIPLAVLYHKLRSSDLHEVQRGLKKLENQNSLLPIKLLLPRIIQIASAEFEEFKGARDPKSETRYKWVHDLAVALIAKTGEHGIIAVIDALNQTLSNEKAMRTIKIFSEISDIRSLKEEEKSTIRRYISDNFLKQDSEPYLPFLTAIPQKELRTVLKVLKHVDKKSYEERQEHDKQNRLKAQNPKQGWERDKLTLRHKWVLLRNRLTTAIVGAVSIVNIYGALQLGISLEFTPLFFQNVGTALVMGGMAVYFSKIHNVLKNRIHWRYAEDAPLIGKEDIVSGAMDLPKLPEKIRKTLRFLRGELSLSALWQAFKLPL